jgi:hypothetical protein
MRWFPRWWSRAFEACFGRAGHFSALSRRGSRGKKAPSRTLRFENLEPRTLLSGNTQVWISDWAGTTEGSPSPGYVVVSRNDTAGDLNLAWSLDGTAGGSDYYLQGSFTIPDGQSSTQVNVQALDDVFAEGPETLLVQLYETPDYTLSGGPSSAELTIADNDPAPPTVSVGGAGTVDAGAPYQLSISASDPNNDIASWSVDWGDGATETGVSVPPSSLSHVYGIPLACGSYGYQITVGVADSLGATCASYNLVTVNAVDPPPPPPPPPEPPVVVSVSASPAAVTEGDGQYAAFTLNFSRPFGSMAWIPLTFSGTASSGSDYSYQDNGVYVYGGQSSVTIGLQVNDDGDREPDETVTLTLQPNSSDWQVDPSAASATVTIRDNDWPVLGVVASDAEACEETGDAAEFTFTRNGGGGLYPASYAYAIFGTAALFSDYQVPGQSFTYNSELNAHVGSVWFDYGQTTATISLLPLDDGIGEPDETVEIELLPGDANGYLAEGAAWWAEAVIHGDRAPTAAGLADVTVDEDALPTVLDLWAAFGDADNADADLLFEVSDVQLTGGTTASFFTWQIDQPTGLLSLCYDQDAFGTALVTVSATDPAGLSAAATFALTVNNVLDLPLLNICGLYGEQISEPEDASSALNAAEVQFVLSEPAAETLLIEYSVGGTATAGIDYASLSGVVEIPAGEQIGRVAIRPLHDMLTEGVETVELTIAPQGPFVVEVNTAKVYIVDGPNQPWVWVVADCAETIAGDTDHPGIFTIFRDGLLDEPLTVFYSLGGSAENAEDYSELLESVTIPRNCSAASIGVLAGLDGDSDEDVVLSLLDSEDYGFGGDTLSTVTIHEPRPVVVDLDTDSDNDGWIDPDNSTYGLDDPIEANAPGRFVRVNSNDSNCNQAADTQENDRPIADECDLAEVRLHVAFDLGETQFADWSLWLFTRATDLNTIWLWKAKDKGGSNKVEWETPANTPNDRCHRLELAADGSLDKTLWVEGRANGTATLELILSNSVTGAEYRDTVRFAVGVVDLTLDGLGEFHEEKPGAIICRNNDFSKENHNAAGMLVADSTRDAAADDLRFDPQYARDYTTAMLTWASWMNAYWNPVLTFPGNIRIWDVTNWSDCTQPPPRLESGVAVQTAADHLDLLVEGFQRSAHFCSDMISVRIEPASGSTQPQRANDTAWRFFRDDARYTVVDVNAAVDGNRDHTIDFAADNPDDRQLTFWYNNDNDGCIEGADIDLAGPYVPDFSSASIDTRRDLEDFAAYYVYADPLLEMFAPPAVTNRSVQYGARLEGNTGATLNLRAQVAARPDQTDIYLCDTRVAMMEERATYLGSASDSEAVNLTTQCKNAKNGLVPLIFEAAGSGVSRPDLVFVTTITYPDGRTKQMTRRVSLELRDITTFYDRWEVPYTEDLRSSYDLVHFGEATLKSASQVSRQRFFDTPEYTVLVHGWNMPFLWKEAFAQTMYKRLYWQGYTGRFGAFNWPTFYDGATPLPFLPNVVSTALGILDFSYNVSELQALRSGYALRSLLESIDARTGHQSTQRIGHNINLLAHSMGNIVVAEALRSWAQQRPDQMLLKSYVAMEAAISAGAYGATVGDAGLLLESTLDLYRYWPTGFDTVPGSATTPCYMESTRSAAGKWINLYNPDDFALMLWGKNNRWAKPGNPSPLWPWEYLVNVERNPTRFFRQHRNEGWPLPESVELTQLTDGLGKPGRHAYEILAFCTQANDKPLGTKALLGRFDVNSDIRAIGLVSRADKRENHSFQFYHDAATTWQFYQHIKQQTGFAATY